MKTTTNIIITSILTVSVIIAGEARLAAKSEKLSDHGINKTKINLTIVSEEDIYGIKFDIRYNAAQLSLSEDEIVSKLPGVNIYSRIKEDGFARVLMLGLTGERLLDVASDSIADLIDIQFKPEGKFRGTSLVELFNITLAGKAGIEIELS